MKTSELLGRINAALGVDYQLQGRFATGENHGAYKLEDSAGTPLVLKWHDQLDILPRLLRARAVTARFRELGVPVPTYLHIGTREGLVYWIQTALPGQPPDDLSISQVQGLLDWNEQQAGQAISSEQDWSWYVRAVVFHGESGWITSLKSYSAETWALLGRLERLTAGKDTRVSRSADLVHGDLGPYNVLVAAGRVSGVVDWDAAGCGDRALDLSKLLFYLYDQPALRALLQQQIVHISGDDALVVYLVYNILAQLDWSIRHHSPEVVTMWLAKAVVILDALEAL